MTDLIGQITEQSQILCWIFYRIGSRRVLRKMSGQKHCIRARRDNFMRQKLRGKLHLAKFLLILIETFLHTSRLSICFPSSSSREIDPQTALGTIGGKANRILLPLKFHYDAFSSAIVIN